MSVLLAAALLLQVRAGVQRDTPSVTDSARRAAEDTVSTYSTTNGRRAPKRIPVTEEHLRTAFGTPAARALLLQARTARMAQDSAIVSYDAMSYTRISAGMGFSKIGRDRLIFRHENAARVRWHRDVGAWIDVTGNRTALPSMPKEAEDSASHEMAGEMAELVPYFPGQEPMITFNDNNVVTSAVDEHDIVHPLASGSEAYYRYEIGDSVSFRPPSGEDIQLRELRVRPRQSKWNVVVGSLWFDTRTAQLVRGVYRFSVPMDIWAMVTEQDSTALDSVPFWVKPLISPLRAQLSSVAVEYGLYKGRFWLPRMRSAEGDARVSFMRVPFKFEQSFKYASVNALDSLPKIVIPERLRAPDSLSAEDRQKWRDSVNAVRLAARRASRDSVKQGLKKLVNVCDTATARLNTRRTTDASNLRIAVRVPCDEKALWNSPDLPASVFDEGEELFGSKERDALIKEALAMGAQPEFGIGLVPPSIKWGLEFTRFNRIEGLSTGVQVEQVLGSGYTANVTGRLGISDLEPNVELGVTRSNLATTIRGRVYHRLVSASDWGNPLSFGSSLSALLFGRDEGFYYRATGAEMEWNSGRGAPLTWRLFGERERTAVPKNRFSLGAGFIPNIESQAGYFGGVTMRLNHTRGLDPQGFRMFTDLRLENALRDSAGAAYARGAVDLTFTQGIGPAAIALTAAGGAAAGSLPTQRRWYLGGPHTVRGQWPDTAQSGNAFWLGRLEVGGPAYGIRPVIFGDIGWVGDRSRIREVGRPLSGVGIGGSLFDGLVRLDLSRGIYPEKRFRFDMYVEAKF